MWSNSRVLKTGLVLLMLWDGSSTRSLFAVKQVPATIQDAGNTSTQIPSTNESSSTTKREGREGTVGEVHGRGPAKVAENPQERQPRIPNAVREVENTLLPHLMSLQSRAAEMGMPPTRTVELSTQVSAIVWANILAGVPPDQALAAARAFGEGALTSFDNEKQTFSLITGQQLGTERLPPVGAFGAIEVRSQQRQEQ